MPIIALLLTVGYERIVRASMDVTQDELRRARQDRDVMAKFDENPLQYVLLSLVDLLEIDSEESREREKEKVKPLPTALHNTMSTPLPISRAVFGGPASTPRHAESHFTSPFQTPDHKRKISDTSFGSQSTDTTPTKLDQPEAKVQSLQNKFVDAIITKLWFGQIDVGWAEGRHMFLTYSEYSNLHFLH